MPRVEIFPECRVWLWVDTFSIGVPGMPAIWPFRIRVGVQKSLRHQLPRPVPSENVVCVAFVDPRRVEQAPIAGKPQYLS